MHKNSPSFLRAKRGDGHRIKSIENVNIFNENLKLIIRSLELKNNK